MLGLFQHPLVHKNAGAGGRVGPETRSGRRMTGWEETSSADKRLIAMANGWSGMGWLAAVRAKRTHRAFAWAAIDRPFGHQNARGEFQSSVIAYSPLRPPLLRLVVAIADSQSCRCG